MAELPEDGRFCRCLLSEFWPEMHASVAAAVALLGEAEKAPLAVYEARLGVCRACEHLVNGTCVLCGCYVESRAARRGMKCPDVPCRWAAWEE